MAKQPFKTLNPLYTQEESEELENQIRESFRQVYEEMLGRKVRSLLFFGSQHLNDDMDLMKKIFLSDGLLLPKSDVDIQYLQYLLKAWRIKNPKRGFAFIETYLQILYPNVWKISQLWQESSKPYPHVLRNEEEMKLSNLPHWLTSRLKIEIESYDAQDPDNVYILKNVFQSIVGARFLIEMLIIQHFEAENLGFKIGMAFMATDFVNVDFVEAIYPVHTYELSNLGLNMGSALLATDFVEMELI